MARSPNGIISAPQMTPEQFVFWARGYIIGTGNERLQNDPNTALMTLLEGLDTVYIPSTSRGGCGCGGKG